MEKPEILQLVHKIHIDYASQFDDMVFGSQMFLNVVIACHHSIEDNFRPMVPVEDHV